MLAQSKILAPYVRNTASIYSATPTHQPVRRLTSHKSREDSEDSEDSEEHPGRSINVGYINS